LNHISCFEVFCLHTAVRADDNYDVLKYVTESEAPRFLHFSV